MRKPGKYANVNIFLFFVHHLNYISSDTKIWFLVLKSVADLRNIFIKGFCETINVSKSWLL